MTANQVPFIHVLYEHDDNSHPLVGTKCQYEHSELDVCYSTFHKIRPFWVVISKVSDYNTCTDDIEKWCLLVFVGVPYQGIITDYDLLLFQQRQCEQLPCRGR